MRLKNSVTSPRMAPIRTLCMWLLFLTAISSWMAGVAQGAPPRAVAPTTVQSKATLNQGVILATADGAGESTRHDEDSEGDEQRSREDVAKSPGLLVRRSATESTAATSAEQTLRSKWSGASIRGFIPLVVVLVVVAVAAWGVKRWLPGARSQENGLLCIEARVTLSAKHSLALVRLGKRFVLVGYAGDRIVRLTDVHDPEEVGHLAGLTAIQRKVREPEFENLLTMAESEFSQEVALMPDAQNEKQKREVGTPSLNRLLGRLRALQPKGR